MSAQSEYERFAKELAGLRKAIASASNDVAKARKSEAVSRSQAIRTSTVSTRSSKLRDAERYATAAAKAERKRADLEAKAADKEKRMHEERAKADKARFDTQIKADRERDRSQKSAMVQLESRLRAEQRTPKLSQVAWGQAPSSETIVTTKKYDIFISHASEDKSDIARPLYEALKSLGVEVWFDEATLQVGDSLRHKIDEGLANSTFGVVILSPNFFAKSWPQAELNGLHARQMSGTAKVILPVWHNISKDQILAEAPTLADTLGLQSALMTVDDMARELTKVVRG